ncbi:MAG: aminotransferase class V-fold PLP-dependent enzyme [Bacteroidia bacterium]
MSLPQKGRPPEAILADLEAFKKADADAKGGRLWSLVYYLNPELLDLAAKAYRQYILENPLNPAAFPSLKRLQGDILRATYELFHLPPEGGGTLTSGGTESLFLALYAARSYAQQHRPEITQPEVVAPSSIHPAVDKAAHYLGLRLIRTPLTEGGTADPEAMEKAISPNTILLLASAPAYPHGVMDPIAEVAALARRYNLLFHVDACIGGFILPFLERLGVEIPPFDFRVEGVTSLSADLHKYGYTPKGLSVLLYRTRALRRYQFFVQEAWSGGIYGSVGFAGTRSAGVLAAGWAVLQYLGQNGYLAAAQQAWTATQRLKAALTEIPALYLVGKPVATIVALAAHPPLNIYEIADELAQRGWFLDRQQNPPSIHLTITAAHATVMDAFIEDLRAVVAKLQRGARPRYWYERLRQGLIARVLRWLPQSWVDRLVQRFRPQASELSPKRLAPIYGLLGALPSGGPTREVVLDFLEKSLDA